MIGGRKVGSLWPGVYLFSAASSCMQDGVRLPLGLPIWVRKPAPQTLSTAAGRATRRTGAGATDKIDAAIYAVDPAAPGISFIERCELACVRSH